LGDLGPLAIRVSWLVRRAVRKVGEQLTATPGSFLDRIAVGLSGADAALFQEPVWRQGLINAMREGFRRGDDGPYVDVRLHLAPWGVDREAIRPVINIWSGGEDGIAGTGAVDQLSRAFPRTEARVYAGEGHFSLYTRRLPDILDSLLATARREHGPELPTS
jgi:hypothetical protein